MIAEVPSAMGERRVHVSSHDKQCRTKIVTKHGVTVNANIETITMSTAVQGQGEQTGRGPGVGRIHKDVRYWHHDIERYGVVGAALLCTLTKHPLAAALGTRTGRTR